MQFNAINKEIGDRRKKDKKANCDDLMEKSKAAKATKEEKRLLAEKLDKERNDKLGRIGNVLSDKVPIFKDEENNEVIKEWGKIPDIEVDGKTLGKLHHHEVMDLLNIVELERGAKVAGHRAYYLRGHGVSLNQALINYGISTLYKNEYTPLQPPYFMKSSIMHETC
jgi:seryl-tRNA synthetase